MLQATESALLTVVNAHTTASSNTISSVDKQMAAAADREAAEEHFVAFCFPTDHKPRGDRARKDHGTV